MTDDKTTDNDFKHHDSLRFFIDELMDVSLKLQEAKCHNQHGCVTCIQLQTLSSTLINPQIKRQSHFQRLSIGVPKKMSSCLSKSLKRTFSVLRQVLSEATSETTNLTNSDRKGGFSSLLKTSLVSCSVHDIASPFGSTLSSSKRGRTDWSPFKLAYFERESAQQPL